MKYTLTNAIIYYHCLKSNFAALSLQDKFTLWNYAKNLPKNSNIVEIGSYLGGSTYIFGNANKNVNIYCVDIWNMNKENYLYKGDIYKNFLNNTKGLNAMPLRGLSSVIAPYFNKKIDLLFIDGGHDFKNVYQDLYSWFPKLNEKAFLLMHDITWLGVRKGIIEYFGTIDYGTIIPNTNLYLIIKDDRLSD